MRLFGPISAAVLVLTCARPADAQQRPLLTEDAEVVGAGRLLVEGGLEYAHDQVYPVSGLTGNIWRMPSLGVSVGISAIAELQIDGGFNHLAITSRSDAPLSSSVTATGDSTNDIEDIVIGTKIRLAAETAGRPAFAFRFATKLPNASNESGLGTDTIDFQASLLIARNIRSTRAVGNFGFAILADPTQGDRQNDVLIYGLSIARAATEQAELVGEVNGRVSTRAGQPFPGTESRANLRLGARYTLGSLRLDAGVLFGLTSVDPILGFTTGFTYVVNAFTLP